MTARTWAKRVTAAAALLAIAAGGYAAITWSALSARHAAHRLRTAADDADRTAWAGKLVAAGDAGFPHLIDALKTGDEPATTAVAAACRQKLTALSPTDPARGEFARRLFEPAPAFGPDGKRSALGLVQDVLTSNDPGLAALCRGVVRDGLAAADPAARAEAARLAMRPDLRLTAHAKPLLADPDAGVRRAALLAVGPAADGDDAAADEDLFPLLHDPDPAVRELCESCLTGRGRSPEEVALARLLAHPAAAERLKLLVDLRFAGDAVKDIAPWLERLGRDPDPAVRAGAARVAVECRVPFAGWVDALADADPDPTVRRVAGYYRGLRPPIGDVRPVGGVGP